MEGYRVPFQDAESEFTEKRSRFISNLWRGPGQKSRGYGRPATTPGIIAGAI